MIRGQGPKCSVVGILRPDFLKGKLRWRALPQNKRSISSGIFKDSVKRRRGLKMAERLVFRNHSAAENGQKVAGAIEPEGRKHASGRAWLVGSRMRRQKTDQFALEPRHAKDTKALRSTRFALTSILNSGTLGSRFRIPLLLSSLPRPFLVPTSLYQLHGLEI